MAAIPIRSLPDPVLRQKARRVPNIDSSIQRLIDDMVDSMRAADGVGLAAPQIGVSLRVIVIEIPDEEPFVLINPKFVKRSGQRLVEEGCLSVPGYRAEITRSAEVVVKGLSREGKPIRIKARDDLLAQALEHEIDHINGVLYVDYVKSPDELHRVEATPSS
ncbi:MAG TPA: peptide deformylase [Dehalococcoidia bacterium]|nr:peptide deformylase [Dehalococcoidia bacterium]